MIKEADIEKIYVYFIQYGMNVLGAVIILVAGLFVAKFLSRLIEGLMLKGKINKTLGSFSRHLAFYGMMTFVVVAALNKLGIETTSFIAVIGAASFAVGLALQGALANFASGVLMILFQPFKVGDIIEAGGAKGRVEEIQIFNTLLITDDKKRVIVPNSKITADKIIIEHSEP